MLDIDAFLPAVGQGAIGLTIGLTARADDAATRGMVAGVLDTTTGVALAAEHAFLGVLDGSCRTSTAGHARVQSGRINFRGMVLRPDGSQTFEIEMTGAVDDAARLGVEAGRDLLARLPAGVLA